MRNNSRKRYITILTIVVVIIVALSVFLYEFVFQTTSVAKIDYSIDDNVTKYYPDEKNSIVIRSSNNGDRDANFYLVLSFTNASFSNQTEQPYVEVNSTIVKIPFLLDKSGASMDASSKSVFFKIDNNVTVFSFHLSLEKRDSNSLESLGSLYDLSYRWNAITKYYEQSEKLVAIP